MERKTYSSDIGDEEWGLVDLYLTLMTEAASPRNDKLREMFYELRWLGRSDVSRRIIPRNLRTLLFQEFFHACDPFC